MRSLFDITTLRVAEIENLYTFFCYFSSLCHFAFINDQFPLFPLFIELLDRDHRIVKASQQWANRHRAIISHFLNHEFLSIMLHIRILSAEKPIHIFHYWLLFTLYNSLRIRIDGIILQQQLGTLFPVFGRYIQNLQFQKLTDFEIDSLIATVSEILQIPKSLTDQKIVSGTFSNILAIANRLFNETAETKIIAARLFRCFAAPEVCNLAA
jgi:hypothetical protein